jgi:hypothetical protein
MKAGSFTMTGSNVAITAPCASEGFRLFSTLTFSFTWAIRSNETANTNAIGDANGATVSAEELSATDFVLEIISPRGFPFVPGETIGFANGASNTVVAVIPTRPGGA